MREVKIETKVGVSPGATRGPKKAFTIKPAPTAKKAVIKPAAAKKPVAKPAATKKPEVAKKATAKPATAKPATAKKPTAKKPTAKKPTAKKATAKKAKTEKPLSEGSKSLLALVKELDDFFGEGFCKEVLEEELITKMLKERPVVKGLSFG